MFYNTVIVERKRFEQLVAAAVNELPPRLRRLMENVDVTVEDRPTRSQRGASRGKRLLLGLYEGVPLTERGAGYGLVLPDKITIFQSSVEAVCSTEAEIEDEIRKTVRHEIAHHFGIDDPALERIETQKHFRHRRM